MDGNGTTDPCRAAPAGVAPARSPAVGEIADATCPRCSGSFHCGVADAAPCACAGVALDPELLRALRQRFAGCLCPGCLRQLAADAGARGQD